MGYEDQSNTPQVIDISNHSKRVSDKLDSLAGLKFERELVGKSTHVQEYAQKKVRGEYKKLETPKTSY